MAYTKGQKKLVEAQYPLKILVWPFFQILLIRLLVPGLEFGEDMRSGKESKELRNESAT